MEYLAHILVLVCIYVILAVSQDLMAGYTGLFSLAHAAFWGVGAYTSAVLSVKAGAPCLVGMLAAVIVGIILGAIVALPSLRFKDDSLILATLAFQVVAVNIMNGWIPLTGGPDGIAGVPQPVILGWHLHSAWDFVILGALLAAACVWFCRRIAASAVVRVLQGIREDEIFTQSLGKNVTAYKMRVFMIGAGMAGLSGALYAHYASYIAPSCFSLAESIFLLSIVIIGGAGSLWGPVLGAIVLVMLPEAFRFLGLPLSLAANLRQLFYGGLLVLFVVWRPQGLLGDYSFSRHLTATDK
jgi:branched-chain amino acid transport system permease protein